MMLIFNNCMTYNADGSEYYNTAADLRKIFDERYSKVFRDEGTFLGQSYE